MQKNIPNNSNSNNAAQQQNISINISYNLNTHKIQKQILASKKSVSKSKKLYKQVPLQKIGNQFFNNIGSLGLMEGKKLQKKENLQRKQIQSSLQQKQMKCLQSQKANQKKKKTSNIKKDQHLLAEQQINRLPESISEYYNPLAQNAKHFLKRNIQSPDIFKNDNPRKLKTEGSMYEPLTEGTSSLGKKKKLIHNIRQQNNSVHAKNPKFNNFIKQTFGTNLITTKLPSSQKVAPKKPLLNTKTPKSKNKPTNLKQKQRRLHTAQNQMCFHANQQIQSRHNKSCMLYSTKKQAPTNIITQPNLLETAGNIMSQYMSVNSTKARKRAQSAYIFDRKNKELVSKLLDMSVIASDIGSSQLITSQRIRSGRNNFTAKRLGLKVDELDHPSYHEYKQFTKKDEPIIDRKIKSSQYRNDEQILPGNALRQYLNSIDLRIIKNIQNDTANIVVTNSQTEKTDNKIFKQKPLQKDTKTYQFLFKVKPKASIDVPNSTAIDVPISTAINIPNSTAIDITNSTAINIPNSKSDVISFYTNLFSKALQTKLQQQEKLNKSGISNKIQFQVGISEQIKNVVVDLNSSDKLLKQTFNIEGFQSENQEHLISYEAKENSNQGQKSQSDEQSQNVIFQFFQKKNQKQEGKMKLNFQHYKELLIKKTQNETQQKNKFDYQLTKFQKQDLFERQNPSLARIQPQKQNKIQISKDFHLQSHQANTEGNDLAYFLQKQPDVQYSLSHLKQEQVEKWNNYAMQVQSIQTPQFFEENRHHEIPNSSHQLNTNPLQPILTQKAQSPRAKASKYSNRQKIIDPQQNQICWQFNLQQFQQQISQPYPQNLLKNEIKNFASSIVQKYEQKQQKTTKYINNSPNNASDDMWSGDEEYDSKKYSSTNFNIEKDKILEQLQHPNSQSKSESQWKTFNQTRLNGNFFRKQLNEVGFENTKVLNYKLCNSSCDDMQQEDISCEQKQINCAERWVNPNFTSELESPNKKQKQIRKKQYNDITEKNIEERCQQSLKDITREPFSQNNYQLQNNYLQCSLDDFGVSKKNNKSKIANQEDPINQKFRFQPHKESSLIVETVNIQSSIVQKILQTRQVTTLKLSINEKQTSEQITLDSCNQKKDPFSQIRRKRLGSIVEDIILELIREFARDISYILKKSSQDKRTQQQFDQNSSPFRNYKEEQQDHELSPFNNKNDQQAFEMVEHHENERNKKRQQFNKKQQFLGKCFGIDTSFGSIQSYLRQFKQYLLKENNMKQAIIKNINKDIGPNSLQILSYLRPEYQGPQSQLGQDQQHQAPNQEQVCEQQEDGLFVVPSEAFSEFENYLELQLQEQNKLLEPEQRKILSQKQKRSTNFWHRGIYESWNQFLDFERPYGINGKPYEWIKERKKFREVNIAQVQLKLQKAIDKLLEAISLPSGIIYDKFDLNALYSDLSEQQKIYLNEQRLSRMLAIQLFESEQTWINYNDQMAELLVELSRVIEEKIFFELATEAKKIHRKRKLLFFTTILDPTQDKIVETTGYYAFKQALQNSEGDNNLSED